jgi:hypothetical protein
LVQNFDLFSTHKDNIADMSKKKSSRAPVAGKVEIRDVRFDDKTDGDIEAWRLAQKRKGVKYKRHQAVEELTKKGLKAEGI